jgi:hypothetical protein
MNDTWRTVKWQKQGHPKALYHDVSGKDAHVHTKLPMPNCDCVKPAHMYQSRHPDTVAHAFHTCGDQRVSNCF